MFEAAAGFAALSTQLEIGRWEDHVEWMRERKYANAQDALFRRQFVNAYNDVVHKHNTLLQDVRRYDQEMRAALEQRDRRIAALEQEMAQLRAELAAAKADVIEYAKARTRQIMSGID